MKKIKVILHAVAILAAVGGAFATRYCRTCEEYVQYIPVNNSYHPAGEFGVDYNCCLSKHACTFYTDSTNRSVLLVPCREGTYTPVAR
jgi:hypothetical protein